VKGWLNYHQISLLMIPRVQLPATEAFLRLLFALLFHSFAQLDALSPALPSLQDQKRKGMRALS
jgi:hypothetical protein